MILYHGSYLAIENPDLLHSRPNLDFGKGFYLTSIREQAVKWCGKFVKRGKQGVISNYIFDEELFQRLKVLRFDSYSEEWLEFILACRSGKDSSDYDAVCGGIANEKPNMQIALRTDAVLTCLRYMGCEKI
jgi:hypothetical protein|nr:DUF3990 domain-containing protein [uncultured Stomatobaculum sp.]